MVTLKYCNHSSAPNYPEVGCYYNRNSAFLRGITLHYEITGLSHLAPLASGPQPGYRIYGKDAL